MTIDIFFNWPPGSNLARISVGQSNSKDLNFMFGIGIVRKNEPDKIYYMGERWIAAEKVNLDFFVKRDDYVVIERKIKNSEKIETRNTWDINKEWPPTAIGNMSTNTPWNF
ncbi:MAG: hypothetical protein HYT36_02790 [Candidatus Staskawiczbacteria bacterium]|nr:hypothetical protein [Candidatus Staskawiczbacteria bacterium]